jgi:hypothetical protein
MNHSNDSICRLRTVSKWNEFICTSVYMFWQQMLETPVFRYY